MIDANFSLNFLIMENISEVLRQFDTIKPHRKKSLFAVKKFYFNYDIEKEKFFAFELSSIREGSKSIKTNHLNCADVQLSPTFPSVLTF